MSRKHRKQKKSPWPILLFGGILLLVAVLWMGLGGERGTPAIVVDRQVIDYGEVQLNTNLTFAIQVTNTGDGVLRFKEKPYIEVLEGC